VLSVQLRYEARNGHHVLRVFRDVMAAAPPGIAVSVYERDRTDLTASTATGSAKTHARVVTALRTPVIPHLSRMTSMIEG
jgi:hypothetical protein